MCAPVCDRDVEDAIADAGAQTGFLSMDAIKARRLVAARQSGAGSGSLC